MSMTPVRLGRSDLHVSPVCLGQLDEDIDAWGTRLSPEWLAQIDRIRWEMRDPAA